MAVAATHSTTADIPITEQILNLVKRATCEAFENGETKGAADQYAEDERDKRALLACLRADLRSEIQEVTESAHRQAGHDGPWNLCRDPICAAIEWWLHFEGADHDCV